MADDTKQPKSFLDSLLDGAEQLIGGVETVLSPQMNQWKIEDAIDSETGRDILVVTNGARKFETSSRDDAEWLVSRLGGGTK